MYYYNNLPFCLFLEKFNFSWVLQLERVGTIAYRLALMPSLSCVHTVFHVSMLRKYTPDLTHVVDWGELVVDVDKTFEEGPV